MSQKKAGRPTKYTPALLKKAEEYLTDFNHHGAQFPSQIGLGLYLDITRETVNAWGKDEDKQPFSYILGKIMDIQHEMLIGYGIEGTYNSAIAKLVLGKHGYHEKTDTNNKTELTMELTEKESKL